MVDQSSQQVKVFLTGATGYIGGTVLTKLLESSSKKYSITALVRSETALPKLKSLGVKGLIGSLDDSELLAKAASEADLVINTANCDHLPSIQALVKGLSTKGSSQKRKILIHTSGTASISDDARGEYTGTEIVSDLDMKKINSIPITVIHKNVDQCIFDNNKDFDSIIISPPTIYGTGKGLFHQHSMQIPALITSFLKYGYAANIGKGLNYWSYVHVTDLADLYVLLAEKALAGKADVGKEGYYFAESGEYQFKDMVAKLGEELFKRGKIKQAEPVQFKNEEVAQFNPFGPFAYLGFASNSRCKADRSRNSGWKPSGKPSIYETLKEEIDHVLSQEQK